MLLAACATPPTDALRGADAAARLGIRAQHELAGVPYFAQERDQCGPATLAMALGATGLAQTPEGLRGSVFVPGRAGSLTPEMLAAARRQGRLAVTLAPSLAAVLREVDAGHPVIVLQNLGLSFFTVWHYALVIGYDLPGGQVLLRSGPDVRAAMGMALFERTWARGGYWALVIADPAALPVTPSADTLVDAASALERVDAAAAHAAYAAVLVRTPGHFGAAMGLGNSAYALGDLPGAVAAFELAARSDPKRGDAWNNLAAALLARGQNEPARAAIERALALGGPNRAVYEQTAAEIAAAAAPPQASPP